MGGSQGSRVKGQGPEPEQTFSLYNKQSNRVLLFLTAEQWTSNKGLYVVLID